MIPLNFAIVFGGIYKVIELFVHKRERLMLISKITELKNIDFKGISLYSSGDGHWLRFPARLLHQYVGYLWRLLFPCR